MDVNLNLRTCTVVIHTILWKFATLRLTSPSGPIRYTILRHDFPWHSSVGLIMWTENWFYSQQVRQNIRDDIFQDLRKRLAELSHFHSDMNSSFFRCFSPFRYRSGLSCTFLLHVASHCELAELLHELRNPTPQTSSSSIIWSYFSTRDALLKWLYCNNSVWTCYEVWTRQDF